MTGTQALLRLHTASLPVSVCSAAEKFGIKIVDYAAFVRVYDAYQQEMFRKISYAGFSLKIDGQFICVLNSGLCHRPRRKWTSAHELGHILSGHISEEVAIITREQEREADQFAADLLAPLSVLHFCGVSSAREIERLCGISRQAAELRFNEISRLRRAQDDLFRLSRRSEHEPDCLFLRSPEDIMLLQRFLPFISSYINCRCPHDGYEQYLIRKSREPMAI